MKEFFSALTLIAIIALAFFAWNRFAPLLRADLDQPDRAEVSGTADALPDDSRHPPRASGTAGTRTAATPPANNGRENGPGAYTDEQLLTNTTRDALKDFKGHSEGGRNFPATEGETSKTADRVEEGARDRLDQSLDLLARLNKLGKR